MKVNKDEERLGLQVQKYTHLLRQNSWTIAFFTLLFTLGAVVVITYLPDLYKATTTILVDPQHIPDRYVASTVTSDPAERLNTITQQVLSESRLSEIVDALDLYPELKGRSHEEVIEHMRKQISIQVKQSSGQGLSSFTITYQGHSPKVVAEVANKLAASFIDWNLRSREQQAEKTTQFLANQLDEAKRTLREQEDKVRSFKMQHLGEMPDQMPANLQTLSRLQASSQANAEALNRLEQEKQLLIRLPEPPRQVPVANLGQRARLEAEQKQLSNDLWELKKKYTDSHPDVIAAEVRLKRVQEQLQQIPATAEPTPDNSVTTVRLELIEREKQRVLEEQRKVQAQFEAYQSKVDAVPVREQQLGDLTRDYEISKEHYRSLLEKTLSAEMATELEHKQEGERFTIMDLAKAPERPFNPNRPALMAGSLLGSFFLVMAFVVFKESMTEFVSSEQELKELLPVSVTMLGAVPSIDTNTDRRRRIKLRVGMVFTCLVACAGVAAILWKVHPIL